MPRWKLLAIHVTLITIASMTLLPLAFMVNNVFRSNHEFYRSFFSIPDAFTGLVGVTGALAGALAEGIAKQWLGDLEPNGADVLITMLPDGKIGTTPAADYFTDIAICEVGLNVVGTSGLDDDGAAGIIVKGEAGLQA